MGGSQLPCRGQVVPHSTLTGALGKVRRAVNIAPTALAVQSRLEGEQPGG
jgi:hypothetical protein